MKNIFKNKKVIITGFNGFKGSWLTIWMDYLGAKVYGIALKDKNVNNHYNLVKNDLNIGEHYLDITNKKKLEKLIYKIQPDFVFHLAAQALVYRSIKEPVFTWETNVIGFLNVLVSLNKLKKRCVAVMVTSDKCYKNIEQKKGYKENDILGGDDPYSASKASSEILFHSFYKSFIKKKNNYLRVCTARAGNVIGGGDWSENRLIPDCMKKWLNNQSVMIRNPNSTRPWQHVLEALNGYLYLANLLNKTDRINGQSFNFSSDKIKNVSVIDFLKIIQNYWPKIRWSISSKKKFKESNLLQLNNSKAKVKLGWKAKLNIYETIDLVIDWYKNFSINKKKILNISVSQIKNFSNK